VQFPQSASLENLASSLDASAKGGMGREVAL